MMLESA